MARARARQTVKQPSRLSSQVVKTLREGALWLFAALALILWFALFTYDPADPGFSQAGSAGEINNGVGRFGALLADLLFNLFGRPAYLFTVMVFYFGWMIFREQ
jgi:S-DNA-T family DNA segregation ATPase FtsK/SpoIIIE